jgi:hypothetical protein
MVTGDFRDFFVALAGAAGALTGLLFVALSLTPRTSPKMETPLVREVRASAALLAFTNALAVSLFGLVPDTDVGYPALVMGIIGLLFTAASLRQLMQSLHTTRARIRQLSLINILLLIFGVELVCGFLIVTERARVAPMHLIGYALVTSVLVGVARAWEIVSDRDTGVIGSIAALVEHRSDPGTPPQDLS